MSKLVLGLDIGVTSVGFGIINIDNGEIIDFGVRLFKESTAKENVTRRTKRGSKRIKRRKKQRLNDLIALLKESEIFDEDFKSNIDPYFCRVKGLNQELSNRELTCALYNIVKHRGSSIETVEETKNADELSAKKALSDNDKILKQGKYVCEIQLDRKINEGIIRGHKNNFRTKDYVNEAIKILSNQKVSEVIKDKIINIIERRREYYEGPGSKLSPTPYGRYISFNQDEPINLIEKMRGKCSIYKNELRAPKHSYSACLFNFLNDLNNLKIYGKEKITVEQKKQIIDIVFEKGGISPSKLARFLGVNIEDISGFRVNKNYEPLLTEFLGLKKIKASLRNNEYILSPNLIDEVIEIITKTKGLLERKELISNLDYNFDNEEIDNLANIVGISGYHSLSLKAIKELNDELINNSLNQMQIKSILFDRNTDLNKLAGNKNIVADKEAILSPVVKRAQREAIKVINRLREMYGEFDSIIIETTRAKNSQEEKNQINESQKYFESLNKKCLKLLEENNSNVKLNKKLRDKLRLYEEQGAKTAYEFLPINIYDLINDPTMYEIDHILPISISLDDSINNKVLVTRGENQRKANFSPIAAIDKGYLHISKKEYIANVISLKKQNKHLYNKKSEYLLFEKDITKFDNMKEFINRNLVDTSYANRIILNTLQDYFKANNINTKVHTVKGSSTSSFRKRVKIEKDRNSEKVGFAHHAIDALIVASLKKFPKINYYLSKYNGYEFINENTGEILEVTKEKEYFESEFINFVANLMTMEKDVVKFSHKIDTKANRKIADETIYSTRIIDNNEFVVKKYKNIYDPKDCSIANDIINLKYDKYLMYKNDLKTFNKLIDIVNYYKKININNKDVFDNVQNKFKKNPLSLYFEDNKMKIKKYSKKDNGPEITQLRYFDGKLGNHISITHNYKVNNKNIVLLQISPYRTDFYYSENKGYKFVTVRYNNISYSKKEKKFIIDKDWYFLEKNKKEIDETFKFCFSMHTDELIKITKKDEDKLYVPIMKFTATNNDKNNVIEVKPINYHESRQLMITIGKKVMSIEKFSTDVCGNLFKINNQELKFKFK